MKMSNDLKIPLLEKKVIFNQQTFDNEPSSQNKRLYAQSYRSCTQRFKLPSAFQKKNSQIQQFPIQAYPLKIPDILLCAIIILLSSLQFGIFVSISDAFPVIGNQISKDFVVLFWKWEIYLIIFILYGSLCHLLTQESSRNSFTLSRTKSMTYTDFAKYFTSTSKFTSFKNLVTLDSLSCAVISVISSLCLFYSARKLSFGLCALINGLTSLIPLYRNQGDNDRTLMILKLISPFFLISGIIVANTSMNNYLAMFLCVFAVFGNQFLNQSTLKNKMRTNSPFQILFSAYINYCIVSAAMIVIINILFLEFSYSTIFFGWLFYGSKTLTYCLIGFGLVGAGQAMFSVFASLVLMEKNALRHIKYFEIIFNDVFGVLLFGKSIYNFTLIYIIGMMQSLLGMFVLDFYPGLARYCEKKEDKKTQ